MDFENSTPEFVQGTFKRYRLTSKLHLGSVQVDLPADAIVDFDGTTLNWGGTTYNVPAVKGAVVNGWLVPARDNVSQYIPKPAGVRVRPAQTDGNTSKETLAIETISDEQEVVGNYKDRMDGRREDARLAAAESDSNYKVTVTPQDLPVEIAPFRPKVAYETEDEEVLVGRVNSPTGAERPQPKVTPAQPPKMKMAISSDDERIVASRGDSGFAKTGGVVVSEDNGAVPVARFSNPAKQTTLLADGAHAAREINRLDNGVPKVERLVQKPTTQITEGEDLKSHPGGTTGDVEHARSGSDLEELLPDALSAGKPKSFDWDMSVHWRTRVTKALAFADKPEALRAICAMEIPSVVKSIKVELAKKGISVPA